MPGASRRGAPPLLKDLQGEVQQLPLALLPPLDHLQDGDRAAQVPPQLQHLLVRRFVVLTVLESEWENRPMGHIRNELVTSTTACSTVEPSKEEQETSWKRTLDATLFRPKPSYCRPLNSE